MSPGIVPHAATSTGTCDCARPAEAGVGRVASDAGVGRVASDAGVGRMAGDAGVGWVAGDAGVDG